jgi:hypothetical protein
MAKNTNEGPDANEGSGPDAKLDIRYDEFISKVKPDPNSTE